MSSVKHDSGLNNHLGYQIRAVAGVVRTALDAELRPLDLTVSQFAILESLSTQPGMSAAQLARAAFVSRQSLHIVLVALEGRGLVTRDRDRDGRAIPARLTPEGARLHATASARVADTERSLYSNLTDQERQQTLDCLRRIAITSAGNDATAGRA